MNLRVLSLRDVPKRAFSTDVHHKVGSKMWKNGVLEVQYLETGSFMHFRSKVKSVIHSFFALM